MTWLRRSVLGLAVILLAGARPAAAQVRAARSLLFGLGYVDGRSAGALRDAIGDSRGVGGYLIYPVVPGRWLGIRFDVGLLTPDEEVSRFPLAVGERTADIRVNTTSNVASAFLGPQLSVSIGPVRPYANAGLGVSRFVYDLFVSATLDQAQQSAFITASATRFALLGGAGVRVPIVRGGGAVSLDAGVHLQRGKAADVPLRGTLTLDEQGGLAVETIRARLDLTTWRAGIAVAF